MRPSAMYSHRSTTQKGRLLTLSSSLESRKFYSQKIRQRNVHVRCIMSMPAMALFIISLGVGSLRCLSCEEAMREPETGIGE